MSVTYIRSLGSVRRLGSVVVVGILVAALAACTGRGGGSLPPGAGFTGQAQFGFQFSCEDKGGTNPPTGRLSVELAYSDKGTSLLARAPFGIHGTVDRIDPVLESAICIGREPPPSPANQLIFLGRFRFTSSPPAGFPTSCPKRETSTTPLCRFEVVVGDNDGDRTPSRGDFFSIRLSSATAVTSDLYPADVFYARAGTLSGGNITVT